MDIEPPHGPIETWKDFFVHLCIITLGLLIALGLEAMVEHIHERNLVREANANITSEMRDNQKHLESYLQSVTTHHADMEHILDYLEQMKQNVHAHGSAQISFSDTDLNTTSWKTAASTGALSYMSYPNVKRYEDVYDSQQEFETTQDRAMDGWADVYASFMRLVMPTQYPNSAAKMRPTTAEVEQIDATEEKVQLYIGRLIAVENSGKNLDQEYTNCLKQSSK